MDPLDEVMPRLEFRRELTVPSGDGAPRVHRWLAQGPEGAVQFVVYEWPLNNPWGEAVEGLRIGPVSSGSVWQGVDLGAHSPRPLWDGHEPMDGNCSVLDGQCYFEGSTLAAVQTLDLVCTGGTLDEDKLKRALALYYASVEWA